MVGTSPVAAAAVACCTPTPGPAYPRAGLKCGAHEGSLQVGWLQRGRGSEPVFLDCWVAPASMEGRTLAELRRSLAEQLDDDAEAWSALFESQPSYVLYCVSADGTREDLCAPHEAPPRDAASGDRGEPWPSLREMLPAPLRDGFSTAQWPSTNRSGGGESRFGRAAARWWSSRRPSCHMR